MVSKEKDTGGKENTGGVIDFDPLKDFAKAHFLKVMQEVRMVLTT
jgi:hypothetical protein